jgi:hypothetical protein
MLPKAISTQILFVYTNCQSLFEKNFDHCSVNKFFGFPAEHVLPYICIDNPLVYANKFTLLQNRNNAAWDQDTLKALTLKFESSA